MILPHTHTIYPILTLPPPIRHFTLYTIPYTSWLSIPLPIPPLSNYSYPYYTPLPLHPPHTIYPTLIIPPTNYCSSMTGIVTFLMMIGGQFIFKHFGWGTAALITPITLVTTGLVRQSGSLISYHSHMHILTNSVVISIAFRRFRSSLLSSSFLSPRRPPPSIVNVVICCLLFVVHD